MVNGVQPGVSQMSKVRVTRTGRDGGGAGHVRKRGRRGSGEVGLGRGVPYNHYHRGVTQDHMRT